MAVVLTLATYIALIMGNKILKCGLGKKIWKVQVWNPLTYHTILLGLIDLILTIPASTTAGCERGFSVINSQRTSLATFTLSDLMCGLLLKVLTLISITHLNRWEKKNMYINVHGD